MEIPVLQSISSRPRILIVRLSAHGDVIHTLPLLTALRVRFPEAEIGWLIDSSAAPLLEGHPGIDRLHVWPRRFGGWSILNPVQGVRLFRAICAMVRELKAQQYEIALDAQGLFKSAMWPFLAGIPKRLGFRCTRECADMFYNIRLPKRDLRVKNRFAADQCLDLARALGCEISEPDFGGLIPSEAARRKINQWLPDAEKPLVVLAPFTRWETKHWSMENWPVLMRALLEAGVQLVVVGAKTDASQVDAMLVQLPAGHGVVNLAGQTDWTDLYALYERTRLMIGLDSGPLHIANAVGVPDIIGLYGPTPAGRTGPIGKQHTVFETDLPCQPCFSRQCRLKTHDCMRKITPEMVIQKALQYLRVPEAAS